MPARSAQRIFCAAIVGAAIAVTGCSDSTIDPPRVEPPSAPGINDPAFTVTGVNLWNLIGNPLTPGDDLIDLDVATPDGTDVVDVWIAGGPGQRLNRDPATGHFSGQFSIAALAPGGYDVLLAADGNTAGFARLPLVRSHPLYVLVSTDWDFAEPGQAALDAHDRLRADHSTIRFTQFVGPYTYTDPAVTDARKNEITTWLTTRRDQFHDEIGLHIHPWCHFVNQAGITCITGQSTVYRDDPSGYTVKVSAYGQADFQTLLQSADQIFTTRGLGKPVTFRAGGWTASSDTLKALAATGYVADTSALNWARMEEWRGSELFNWNMLTWSLMGDSSQPYHPNTDDKQSQLAPHIPILEVPDNAIMVDYVSTAEMIEIFGRNWNGDALTAPTVYMMGFHPSVNFTPDEYDRVDGLLTHADQFEASRHTGPVVYTVLRDLPTVWNQP
jgi:hypothetical protein